MVVDTAVDVETTVLVLIPIDVLVAVSVSVPVRVSVCVPVDVAVTVRISVWVVVLALPPSSFPPFPVFNLCCAPANRPMKTEESNSRRRTRTSRILVRVVNGSCTMDDMRCTNVGLCVGSSFPSGCETSWRRGAVSDSERQYAK